MDLTLRIVLILAMVFYFTVLLTFIRKRGLNLKYMLLWLFIGLVLFVLLLFPEMLTMISNLLGFQEEINALISAICFFIILLEICLTAIASRHNEKLTRLIQRIAILEKRIKVLEAKIDEKELKDSK